MKLDDLPFIDDNFEDYLEHLKTKMDLDFTIKNKSSKINVRNCLRCFEQFQSQGKHNRLCEDCRKQNGYE